jgi:catechol 2,3-dioxygenase
MMPSPSFTIHPDTRLGAVALTVSDLAQASRFYESILGLTTAERQGNGVALSADEGPALIRLTERLNAQPKPARTTGLYHFAILLPHRRGLANALRRLVEKRYPVQGAADHGVSEAIYLADPDGNGIEIYTDRPREDWPWHDGQLQMITAALDTQSLMEEATDDGLGLPHGTRIGHVHLHVAELEPARRFYQDWLGFDLVQRFPPDAANRASALFLSAGGYHHHIGLNVWAGVGAPAPPQESVGLRYFVVRVPDDVELNRLASRLETAGVSFERPVAEATGLAGLLVRDPSSNNILIDTP